MTKIETSENFGLRHLGHFISKIPDDLDPEVCKRIINGMNANKLYTVLSEEQIDASVAVTEICKLASEFRTIMHEQNKWITNTQKSRLNAAFRSVMVDIEAIVKRHKHDGALAAKKKPQGWISRGKNIVIVKTLKTYRHLKDCLISEDHNNETLEDILVSVKNVMKTIDRDEPSIEDTKNVTPKKSAESDTQNIEGIVTTEGVGFDEDDGDDDFFDALDVPYEKLDKEQKRLLEEEWAYSLQAELKKAQEKEPESMSEKDPVTDGIAMSKEEDDALCEIFISKALEEVDGIMSEETLTEKEPKTSTLRKAEEPDSAKISLGKKIAKAAGAVVSLGKKIVKAPGDAVAKGVEAAVQKKVKNVAENYTPDKFFGEESFEDFIGGMLSDSISSSIIKPEKLVQKYTKRLGKNLSYIVREQNIQRFGIRVLTTMSSGLRIVNDGSDEEMLNPDEILQGLGIDKTFKEYKKYVQEAFIKRAAALLTNNEEKASKEEMNVGEKIFTFIKDKFYEFTRKILKIFVRVALKTILPVLPRIMGHGNKEGDDTEQQPAPFSKRLLNHFLKRMGITETLAQAQAQSDVVFYYTLDQVSEEMIDIVQEASAKERKGEGTDVSGKEPTELYEDMQDAVASISEEVATFTAEKGKGLQNVMLRALAQKSHGVIRALVGRQGSEKKFDIATPAAKIVIPAWREWITADFEDEGYIPHIDERPIGG